MLLYDSKLVSFSREIKVPLDRFTCCFSFLYGAAEIQDPKSGAKSKMNGHTLKQTRDAHSCPQLSVLFGIFPFSVGMCHQCNNIL